VLVVGRSGEIGIRSRLKNFFLQFLSASKFFATLETKEENNLAALRPFFGILSSF
jgi:hypothetical protein